MFIEDKYRLLQQDFQINPEPVSMLKNLSNTLRNNNKTSHSISSWIPRKPSKPKPTPHTHQAHHPTATTSVYHTIKTQPTTLNRTKTFWGTSIKKSLKSQATLPQFKSLTRNQAGKSTMTNSFTVISRKPKMTRELSDLCSMDVQSKEFKLKLLISNIGGLRDREPRMAMALGTHLDRKSIKKRLSMFKHQTTHTTIEREGV